MLAFTPDTASACQVRSLWNRSWIPGCLPLHNSPQLPSTVLIVGVSLEERYGASASVPSYPLGYPWGYTGTHASPFGHTLGWLCHCDNREKCLKKTMRQWWEFMRLWLCTFTGIWPSAYRTQPPVVLHLYLQLHKLWLITGEYAQAGGLK